MPLLPGRRALTPTGARGAPPTPTGGGGGGGWTPVATEVQKNMYMPMHADRSPAAAAGGSSGGGGGGKEGANHSMLVGSKGRQTMGGVMIGHDSSGSSILLNPEYEIDTKDITFCEVVGRGSTSTVYRCLWRETEVAVKTISNDILTSKQRAEFFREISVMSKLRHPNLVLLMGFATQPQRLCIVTEYCRGGSLFDLLHSDSRPSGGGGDAAAGVSASFNAAPKLTWAQRFKIAEDISRACTYLHSSYPRIVHRDVKSLNILLAEPITSKNDVPHAKISDFGLSRFLYAAAAGERKDTVTGAAGTYHWMAPEVVRNEQYDEKADVFSFGIVLYELLSGAIPYSNTSADTAGAEGSSARDVALSAARGVRPDLSLIPGECPTSLRKTMECCWDPLPANRPSFAYVLDVIARAKLLLC
eukprot:GHVU01137964.1.p1 GENE.GHVU01137964.1~~GHVU01137964.1.p1  ORF type:complete len:416 (+),score=68.43 GHVU01137964.1:787-2034(+)